MADKDAIYDRVAGKVKETAGKVTGDKETETEGKLQSIEGKVAEKFGEVKDEVAENCRRRQGRCQGRVRPLQEGRVRFGPALH